MIWNECNVLLNVRFYFLFLFIYNFYSTIYSFRGKKNSPARPRAMINYLCVPRTSVRGDVTFYQPWNGNFWMSEEKKSPSGSISLFLMTVFFLVEFKTNTNFLGNISCTGSRGRSRVSNASRGSVELIQHEQRLILIKKILFIYFLLKYY